MKKQKNIDPLLDEMERALKPDRFIEYRDSWDFVSALGDIKSKIDALVKKGEAKRAVTLYETFLSGCHEKAEELDDSGGSLGSFFEDLFCDWIKARQKADCPAEETVELILRWMDNDDYGFFYNTENNIALALDRKGRAIFTGHFNELFAEAYAPFEAEAPKYMYDYPREVYENAGILKKIHIARKDIKAYMALCEKIAISPRDCEALAMMQQDKGEYDGALATVERGIALRPQRNWGNEESSSLANMKQELLGKLGRKEEAFTSAWESFKSYPSDFRYDEMMRYSQEDEREEWHSKAIDFAREKSLDAFISICVKTKEWDMLAEHILAVDNEKLEALSHYTTEDAAAGLSRSHSLAAAKTYRALGLRILKSGKSKYYGPALSHFRKARDLYKKSGREDLWQSLVDLTRKNHSRKYGFIGDFNKIAAGSAPEKPPSFEKRMRKRWEKQTN